MTDLIAPLVPFGLALGRLGNFINGELWGRPTDLSWGYRTIVVKWDNGSNLSLIEGSGDSWREITNV